MIKTCVHFEKCKTTKAVAHNLRTKSKGLDYVRDDLTYLNENWHISRDGMFTKGIEAIDSQIRKEAWKTRGRKVRTDLMNIREMFVRIAPQTTIDDMLRFAQRTEKELGIEVLIMTTHKDEGAFISKEEANELLTEDKDNLRLLTYEEDGQIWKSNSHAHVVFSLISHETGVAARLKPKQCEQLQTIAAETFLMERGKPSDAKHLKPMQYKAKLAKEQAEKAQAKAQEAAKDERDAQQRAALANKQAEQARTRAEEAAHAEQRAKSQEQEARQGAQAWLSVCKDAQSEAEKLNEYLDAYGVGIDTTAARNAQAEAERLAAEKAERERKEKQEQEYERQAKAAAQKQLKPKVIDFTPKL